MSCKYVLKIISILFIVFIFFGCSSWEEEKLTQLSDIRFNGKFIYEYKYEGHYEQHEKLEINFDKTNQAVFYHSIRNYNYSTIGDRWEIWSDYGTMKFEVKDNKYRIATWSVTGNYESEFTDWQIYSFSDDGRTLVLQNYNYKINNMRNYTLNKE